MSIRFPNFNYSWADGFQYHENGGRHRTRVRVRVGWLGPNHIKSFTTWLQVLSLLVHVAGCLGYLFPCFLKNTAQVGKLLLKFTYHSELILAWLTIWASLPLYKRCLNRFFQVKCKEHCVFLLKFQSRGSNRATWISDIGWLKHVLGYLKMW
jgi:hypothetical protein